MLQKSYDESYLWIAVQDACKDIISTLANENELNNASMEEKMVLLRGVLHGRMFKEGVYNGTLTQLPINMKSFGLRGEDKKTCEAYFEQALIDYEKSRTAELKPNGTAKEWIKALRAVSGNIAAHSVLSYVEGVLNQVYNAQLAANILAGNPVQEILYLKSTYLGNGKSTLMNNFKEGAIANGLKASIAQWPEYGYHDMTPFMTNHMTFIDDSMNKEKNIDLAQLGAIGRREEVVTTAKYKGDVKGKAQGFVMAAGNRDPYNKGDRTWRTIDVMPIDIKDISAILDTDITTDTCKSLYYIDLQENISFIRKILKTIKEDKSVSKSSDADISLKSDIAIQKEIGDYTIALIKQADIDLKKFTVKKLVDYYRNTPDAIYTQSAASLANALNKLYKSKLITRSSRSGDPTKTVYDLEFIKYHNFEDIELLPDSDFDVVMQAQKEWDLIESYFDDNNGPNSPTKSKEENNNENELDIDRGADSISLQQNRAGETNIEESEAQSNIELYDTGAERELEEAVNAENNAKQSIDTKKSQEKTSMTSLTNVLNKLTETIEKPEEINMTSQNVKLVYTFDDGTTQTLIKSLEQFKKNELLLWEDNVQPFYATMIERGYTKQCKPNPLGVKTIKATFTDEPPTCSDTPEKVANTDTMTTEQKIQYLKLNDCATDATKFAKLTTEFKTEEGNMWDKALKKALDIEQEIENDFN